MLLGPAARHRCIDERQNARPRPVAVAAHSARTPSSLNNGAQWRRPSRPRDGSKSPGNADKLTKHGSASELSFLILTAGAVISPRGDCAHLKGWHFCNADVVFRLSGLGGDELETVCLLCCQFAIAFRGSFLLVGLLEIRGGLPGGDGTSTWRRTYMLQFGARLIKPRKSRRLVWVFVLALFCSAWGDIKALSGATTSESDSVACCRKQTDAMFKIDQPPYTSSCT